MTDLIRSTFSKMNQYLHWLFLLIFSITFLGQSKATHNRAGEIRIEQPGEDCSSLTIKAYVTTYTKASSTTADRDSITICWGDGFCEKIFREEEDLLGNDIKRSVYEGEHTYAGRGRYTISMTDPNRISDIININNGRSVQVPFYIETVYSFLDPQFQGCNSTPILEQPPIDIGCVGKEFKHNPNAYDIDGDSLSYELIIPLQADGVQVPGYQFPNQVNPGGNNLMDLNEVTGDFIWSAPQKEGDYNLAIMIIEHRNGIAIDTTIRDLQIQIKACDNQPPEIKTIREICVVAGELLEFEVKATAPDFETMQKVSLEAFGGPLEIRDSAVFNVAPGFQDQELVGTFRWQTTCNHIATQYYKVVFRAQDNFPVIISPERDSSFLSTLETVLIKVVGPSPEDLQAETTTSAVNLSWESPYDCEDAREDYFYGFSVWRKLGSNPFSIDTCETGLAGKGYTQIAFLTQDLDNGRYVFSDSDVERGRTYCYRIFARFAKYTDNGQPYNLVESLPSEEICVQLSKDIPLITNVDVMETDAFDGHILVKWSKPNGEDLDTIQNPGPYRYRVIRANGITDTGFQPVVGGDFSQPTFALANDTCFIDSSGLNTAGEPYSYKVEFYVNGESDPLGDTENASSIFLNIFETDEENELSWEFDVPWLNIEYVIYRDDDLDGTFDSIAVTRDTIYEDLELINGKEYCYYVEAIGSYGVDGIVDPILNKSQRQCGTPIDNVPPCPPPLIVANICDDDADQELIDNIENRLTWFNPESICEKTDDVNGYKVYYSADSLGQFDLIAEIDFEDDTTYYHSTDLGLIGCYAVSAVDSIGNESELSNVVCRDNCPFYELPNVFTPNGDDQNEVFKPFPYRFIANIEMKVFNRWGNLVFETTDPDINWDGTNLAGDLLNNGVYFYRCQVFEQRLGGTALPANSLSGYIELVRDSN